MARSDSRIGDEGCLAYPLVCVAGTENSALWELIHTKSELEGRPETTFQLCCRYQHSPQPGSGLRQLCSFRGGLFSAPPEFWEPLPLNGSRVSYTLVMALVSYSPDPEFSREHQCHHILVLVGGNGETPCPSIPQSLALWGQPAYLLSCLLQ